MARDPINTLNDLRRWLTDKPTYCAQVIALRAASRALPLIVNSSEFWLSSFALLPFSAVLTSWFQLADRSIFVRTEESRANARFGGDLFDFAGFKMEHIAALTADASYHSADAQSGSVWAASDCLEAVTKAADAFYAEPPSDTGPDFKPVSGVRAFWQSVAADCNWLSDNGNTEHASRELTLMPLWLTAQPTHWYRGWGVLVHQLRSIDPNYSVWIDWYERRVRGEPSSFDIPGDKRRVEDKKILRRLAEATDEDFWGKGHEYVNATLKGWLDEARARVAPPIQAEVSGTFEITGNAEGTVQTPLQNRNAISFRTDENGRIAIDAQAALNNLRTDEGARDRHAEAVSEALALLNRCKGNNAAARLSLRLENYLAAAGTDLENAKPSLLVQRGEKLRQELAAYAAPDTLLDPIADDILVDLKGWQSAHNMLVGLDPVLMAIDTAMLGPDGRPALMSPDEIREFAHDAQQADLLAEGTEVILIEAADLAPEIPDPTNRLTNASIEMVRNLCIETVSIALNHPMVTAGVAVTTVALSSNVVAGIVGGLSLMSSIKAAEYLVNHRQWVEEKMGNTPTWQSLLSQVADWLEKVTPFRPK